MKWLGVDTGGTFTDFVLWDTSGLKIHKVLSTPNAPERAILQGIEELQLIPDIESNNILVIHGSTVVTNAALERKGVKTVYVANKGLKDVLTIGRQARPELYNLTPEPVAPPVPRELCLELDCRVDANGEVEKALDEEELNALKAKLQALSPQAVAVNFLFSFLNDKHEQQVKQLLGDEYYVACSAEVLPEYKEYERGIATWLNAWLGPIVQRYLQRLETGLQPCRIAMMQSSGGTISVSQAADRAVHLMLSGPAGGLAAGLHLGRELGKHRLLTFDMGGTSTDVAMLDGRIRLTSEGKIAGFPVAVPSVDMHTIGAGGGSVAWIDQGGMLQVGPESAGADPGPACYGRGGGRPAVTDANLILGRIPESVLLGGYLPLDREAAEAVMKPVADQLGLTVTGLARGIIRIANEHMARALRVISVFRGYRPHDFALFCFGGAGGLHLCDLAEELDMKEAVFPANGGVLSAFGMLVAPKQRNFSQTLVARLSEIPASEVIRELTGLTEKALQELAAEQVTPSQCHLEWSLACRYLGQSFTLEILFQEADLSAGAQASGAGLDLRIIAEKFHQAHEKRFGYQLQREIELVTVRCRVFAEVSPPALPLANTDSVNQGAISPEDKGAAAPVMTRDALIVSRSYDGPLIVTDSVSTLFVKTGWKVMRNEVNHLLLTRE